MKCREGGGRRGGLDRQAMFEESYITVLKPNLSVHYNYKL